MQKSRFSPIEDKEKLLEAVAYVAAQTSAMSDAVLGKHFPIHSLTIFSHDQKEFETLSKILLELGNLYNENNGPRVQLHTPVVVGEHTITLVRVRKPDPGRPQVGCNDFDIPNYEEFKAQYLASHPKHLRLVFRPEYEMIEFFHLDFSVLAYVVSK